MLTVNKADPEDASLAQATAARSARTPTRPQAERLSRWIELSSAVLMAATTIATVWCGYQSARWNGKQATHRSRAEAAVVRTAKFANLAEQKSSLHAQLFVQWVAAVSADNTALADFLVKRFPEPLKAATTAWRATRPFTSPAAPATPLDMPEYTRAEAAASAHWEETAIKEFALSDRANEMADRYLMFTIIYACVLFFAGISGKFRWQAIDVAMLVLAGLVLLIGLGVMLTIPVA
jgi:hypothetical protein